MSEPRRKVAVMLERTVVQRIDVTAMVPASWTDEDVRQRLGEVYAACGFHSEWDVVADIKATQGSHEVLGEPGDPDYNVVYCPGRDRDEPCEGEGDEDE